MEDENRVVLRKMRITPAVVEAGRANIAGINAKRQKEGLSEETKAKLRAAAQSEEGRAKRSASQKARWARAKAEKENEESNP